MYVSITGPIGASNSPTLVLVLVKSLLRDPTAKQVVVEHETPSSPLALSWASGFGLDVADHCWLVWVAITGPGPASCPTATHIAAVEHETPARAHVPYPGMGPSEPGLGVIDQPLAPSASAKVSVERDVPS